MSEHGERANYITCPKGHKVFVIWSKERKKFGFTCEECDEHSEVAISILTGHVIILKARRMRRNEFTNA
jgi:hypothetical protein